MTFGRARHRLKHVPGEEYSPCNTDVSFTTISILAETYPNHGSAGAGVGFVSSVSSGQFRLSTVVNSVVNGVSKAIRVRTVVEHVAAPALNSYNKRRRQYFWRMEETQRVICEIRR